MWSMLLIINLRIGSLVFLGIVSKGLLFIELIVAGFAFSGSSTISVLRDYALFVVSV